MYYIDHVHVLQVQGTQQCKRRLRENGFERKVVLLSVLQLCSQVVRRTAIEKKIENKFISLAPFWHLLSRCFSAFFVSIFCANFPRSHRHFQHFIHFRRRFCSRSKEFVVCLASTEVPHADTHTPRHLHKFTILASIFSCHVYGVIYSISKWHPILHYDIVFHSSFCVCLISCRARASRFSRIKYPIPIRIAHTSKHLRKARPSFSSFPVLTLRFELMRNTEHDNKIRGSQFRGKQPTHNSHLTGMSVGTRPCVTFSALSSTLHASVPPCYACHSYD